MWLAILLTNVGIVNFFIPSTLHSRKIMGIEVNLAGAINTTAKGLVRSTKARYKSFSKGQVAALRPAVDSPVVARNVPNSAYHSRVSQRETSKHLNFLVKFLGS